MTSSLRRFHYLLPAILIVSSATPPLLGAWQQRVDYTMDVRLLTDNRALEGEQRLVYHNNSPDTISYVYYHLFYNAFRSGSMFFRLNRTEENNPLHPSFQGGVRIDSMWQDGVPLTWSIDETILRAELDRPVAPGDSTILRMQWFTQIPLVIRRGGHTSPEGVEYTMTQWYPKLAAYDEHGWHPDIYVRREFYGVFGTYTVSITLPARYVVGATGLLVNPAEVRCGYELGSVDTLLLYPASGKGDKTWRFRAEKVHDFAWSADPGYFHEIARCGDVTLHLLARRDARLRWSRAASMTRRLLAYYSRRFGDYGWPQFTIAQGGDGGMEYPMISMITGFRTETSLWGVIAHELAHQWFYGMVANNETDEAWLDEGFAEYLASEARRDTLDLAQTTNPYTGLDRLIYPWWYAPNYRNVENYYRLAVRGLEEPLSTYHDRFRDEQSSALVYNKGEGILRMLQTMLGDSIFDTGMRRYVDRWRWRHPSTRDFEREMERASGMRLDWFFNQWVTLSRTCDFGLTRLSSDQRTDGWTTTIEMERKGECEMPLVLELMYDDGTTSRLFVPIDGWRHPDLESAATPWRWIDRSYRTTIATRQEVVRATIDPDMTLLDIDRTDNTRGSSFPGGFLSGTHVAMWRRWDMDRPPDAYSVRVRPLIWYSQGDGAEFGVVADGGYTFDRYGARAGVSYNVGSRRFDYDLAYSTTISLPVGMGRVDIAAVAADGVRSLGARIGTESNRAPTHTKGIGHRARMTIDYERLIGPDYPNGLIPWDKGDFASIGVEYGLTASGPFGHPFISATVGGTTAIATERRYTEWRLSAFGRHRVAGIAARLDLFVGASVGNLPMQRQFDLAGASARSLHSTTIHRLAANISPEFARRNRLVLPREGWLFSLLDAPGGHRGAGAINTRLSLGNLRDLPLVGLLKEVGLTDARLYGSVGWLFNGDLSVHGLATPPSVEAGVWGTFDLVNLLLPQRIIDLLDLPTPILLSIHLPLVASSPRLEQQGFRLRSPAIGITL